MPRDMKPKKGERGVSRHRKHRKNVSRQAMQNYINKNLKSATEKLKYLKKTGVYKASDIAQQAYSQLKMLYRKVGVDEDSFHTGKNFKSKLLTNADLKILYNVIYDIRDINTRATRKELERRKAEYSQFGIDYEESFNVLSMLSSEFHEIYSFISYNEVISAMKEVKGGVTPEELLSEFMYRIEDKLLDDTQTEKAKVLMSKIQNKVDSKTLHSMFREHRSVFKKYGKRR
ncbi:MAG: hypothetical protein MJZ03_04535 [archaeon]|nr:hypothetical protein [archaeon]